MLYEESIVINSVSMTDGRKMNEDRAMYRLFRKTSDEICLESTVVASRWVNVVAGAGSVKSSAGTYTA